MTPETTTTTTTPADLAVEDTSLAGAWQWASRRRGNFEYRAVVGAMDFRARDAHIDRQYFGLSHLATYLYSSMRDADGNFLAPMRKHGAEMSSGLQLSTNVGRDAIDLDVDAMLRSQRGAGIRWTLEPDGSGFTIDAGASPFNQPVRTRITDDELWWSEGDLIELHGRRLGMGYQWLTPMVDEGGGNLYCSAGFHATGTVLGVPVEGFIGLDQLYGPQGQVFKTGPYFNGLELAWVAFCNIYDDDAFEFGGLCLGREHWGWSVVVDADGERLAETETEADVQLRDDGYIGTATYHTGDGDYTFTADPRGAMVGLARARGDNYRAICGTVRKAGDPRTPRVSTAWIENMPANGLDRRR